VEQHPELIDVNYESHDVDWNHINSIDYNAKLDQILLSSRYFSEIWVIDHSTTTAEAASHTGGRYDKGGDLLYRWGNPQTYQRGTADDQILFDQHDARWIPEGFPGAGNILVFNNGYTRKNQSFSSVDELTPPMTQNGDYLINAGSPYGPEEKTWSYTADPPEDFYSESLSSAQRLPNGDTLICEGNSGYFFEITMNKTKVWEYQNTFSVPFNEVFQVIRYPMNYSGILSRNSYKPYPPTMPNGPTSGETALTYSFSTSTIDPNDDQLTYVFAWGDTSTTTIGPVSSGYSVVASHHWETPGTYVIRVKAIDMNTTMESEWSEPLLVHIQWNMVFLIGRLDEMHRHNETISFFANSLLYLDMHPFEWIRYSSGVYMIVSAKYVGILTSRICIGRFQLRSIN
jgi:Arylsulfotransferase (ASST)